jgi:hypothetical protein
MDKMFGDARVWAVSKDLVHKLREFAMATTMRTHGGNAVKSANHGEVVYDGAGVFAVVGTNAIHIRLPQIESDMGYSRVFHSFQQIYDKGFDNIDWIVDVSSIPNVPLSLLSVLTSFREDLELKGHRLLLAGLKPDSFPPARNQTGPLFSSQGFTSLAR